jgi:hypothetical protein
MKNHSKNEKSQKTILEKRNLYQNEKIRQKREK